MAGEHSEIPFDVSCRFDGNLRDIPNSPHEMQKAIDWLQQKLMMAPHGSQTYGKTLSSIGVFLRILEKLGDSEIVLKEAVRVFKRLGDTLNQTVAEIRLANTIHWLRRYDEADEMFRQLIERTQGDPTLHGYLDFAHQHAGKCKMDQGHFDAAIFHFERALEIRGARGAFDLISSTQLALDEARRRKARLQKQR